VKSKPILSYEEANVLVELLTNEAARVGDSISVGCICPEYGVFGAAIRDGHKSLEVYTKVNAKETIAFFANL
jgi:hypothetical protein